MLDFVLSQALYRHYDNDWVVPSGPLGFGKTNYDFLLGYVTGDTFEKSGINPSANVG